MVKRKLAIALGITLTLSLTTFLVSDVIIGWDLLTYTTQLTGFNVLFPKFTIYSQEYIIIDFLLLKFASISGKYLFPAL